jgi:hypothetical protein
MVMTWADVMIGNDAVAMTGGQRVEGRLDVPTLTRWLALEGVTKVVITTPEPGDYRGIRLDPIATVRHRDDFAEAERELSALSGVTVLIHDDRCAAEERRLRKRGKLPTPKERVAINERVCEALLGFDLIGAASDVNLSTARPGHTVAVVNTALVPTLGMVTHRVPLPTSPANALERVESVAETFCLDALGLAEKLFGDHLPANMVLVGAAFQYGCLPLTADAIEEAIRLNGAAVEANLAAFRSGRASIVNPLATGEVEPVEPAGMAVWVDDLTDYQDSAYARRFAEAVSQAEAAVDGKVDQETGKETSRDPARCLRLRASPPGGAGAHCGVPGLDDERLRASHLRYGQAGARHRRVARANPRLRGDQTCPYRRIS